MKIVADNKIPYLKGALESFAEVLYLPGKDICQKDILDADALITRTRTKCNQDLLEGTKIKFITTATIGYDHIDTDYCEKNGIFWTNAPGCNSSSVQQYIASALLTLAKKMKFNLSEKIIGIIGVGNVGSKVEKLARIIGMKVLLNDPPRERKEGKDKFVSLNEIIEKSDIITLHVPLNLKGIDKTFHLFDKNKLHLLKKGTILINTSRGEVVENNALKKVLKKKRIKATVFDVFEGEPDIDLQLLSLLTISTPHIAGYSKDGKANGTAMSVQALSRFFKLPLNNWYPENIEMTENNEIEIDGDGKMKQEIFTEAIIRTYNILKDDIQFRNNPKYFEKLRGEYPVRREFNSYTLKLKNVKANIIGGLKELGFNIYQ